MRVHVFDDVSLFSEHGSPRFRESAASQTHHSLWGGLLSGSERDDLIAAKFKFVQNAIGQNPRDFDFTVDLSNLSSALTPSSQIYSTLLLSSTQLHSTIPRAVGGSKTESVIFKNLQKSSVWRTSTSLTTFRSPFRKEFVRLDISQKKK
jgi:hypothetical protein